MSFIDINGAKIHYEERGSGPDAIVFSHGLLASGDMFGDQVTAFESRFRCISYDHQGQARSQVTESGYDMDSLTGSARPPACAGRLQGQKGTRSVRHASVK